MVVLLDRRVLVHDHVRDLRHHDLRRRHGIRLQSLSALKFGVQETAFKDIYPSYDWDYGRHAGHRHVDRPGYWCRLPSTKSASMPYKSQISPHVFPESPNVLFLFIQFPPVLETNFNRLLQKF